MYTLSIDLGTTYTAAAVLDGTGVPKSVTLGKRAQQVPSVLYLEEDGAFLFGEVAEQRGRVDPTRLRRETKRRIGDRQAIYIAGSTYSAADLTARQLRWVVDLCTERYGGPPTRVVLTHPASWTERQLGVLTEAAEMADLPQALLVPEPVAAATYYAAQQRVPEGATFCIYDLGGGTFDVCVVRKESGSFRILGDARGIDDLGGVDFDDAIRNRVAEQLDNLPDDPADPSLYRLSEDCVKAKEELSDATAAIITVFLADQRRPVRLTRPEFEDMISDRIDDTIRETDRAIQSAGVSASQITGIVLVGGSSRIPLVAERLMERFKCDVTKDTDPKHDIALGAVLFAAEGQPAEDTGSTGNGVAAGAGSTGDHQRRRRKILAATAAAATAVLVAGVVLAINLLEPFEDADGGTATSSGAVSGVAAGSAPASPSMNGASAVTPGSEASGPPTPSSSNGPSTSGLPGTTAATGSASLPPAPSSLDGETVDWARTVCQVNVDIAAYTIKPGASYPSPAAVRAAYVNLYEAKALVARSAATELRSAIPVVLAAGRIDPVASVQKLDRLADVLSAGSQSLADLVPVKVLDYNTLATAINDQADKVGLALDLNQLTIDELNYLSYLPGCESLR